MKDYSNFYFFNGNAYAGKSTMVKLLAEKYGGIACEENYHNEYLDDLDPAEFPNLTYTRDLEDFADFIRRTPDEYEAWIKGASKESEIMELRILEGLNECGRKVFVDTNISLDTLHTISDKNHVCVMLADPDISVRRFFERPDREKQYLYQLMMKEPDPQASLDNFRECLKRINTQESYDRFLNSGFTVVKRDESRSPEETAELIARLLGITE